MDLVAQGVELDPMRLAGFKREVLFDSAQRFDLMRGLHFELALFADGEDARQRHGASPSGGGEFGFRPRLAQPTPQNAAAIWGAKAFGRVVGAVIEHAVTFRRETMGLAVVVARGPDDLAFSGIEQAVLSVDFEE